MAIKQLSILFAFFMISASSVYSQMIEPVKWTFEFKKTDDGQYELIFTANIEENWRLFSQDLSSDDPEAILPIPLSFGFENNKNVELIGKVESQSRLYKEYDPNFELTLGVYKKEAIFVQRVEVNKKTSLTGYLEFMSAKDEQCMLLQVDFEFIIKD